MVRKDLIVLKRNNGIKKNQINYLQVGQVLVSFKIELVYVKKVILMSRKWSDKSSLQAQWNRLSNYIAGLEELIVLRIIKLILQDLEKTHTKYK